MSVYTLCVICVNDGDVTKRRDRNANRQTDSQTDSQTPEQCITLTAMDAVNVIKWVKIYRVSLSLSFRLEIPRVRGQPLKIYRVYCGKTADWIRMPFGVVSGIGRGRGVLHGWWSSKGMDSFGDKCGTSHCNQWGLCGVVILCREGRRRGFSQITLGFLVSLLKLICRFFQATVCAISDRFCLAYFLPVAVLRWGQRAQPPKSWPGPPKFVSW